MYCNKYILIRKDLKDAIKNFSEFNIDNILFGCPELNINDKMHIFEAVHKFINASNRFR